MRLERNRNATGDQKGSGVSATRARRYLNSYADTARGYKPWKEAELLSPANWVPLPGRSPIKARWWGGASSRWLQPPIDWCVHAPPHFCAIIQRFFNDFFFFLLNIKYRLELMFSLAACLFLKEFQLGRCLFWSTALGIFLCKCVIQLKRNGR